MSSELVEGYRIRESTVALPSYLTKTPPRINEKTNILAATSPDLNKAGPSDEGWFLSDFYAFNILFKGLGASQKWLTAASPQNVVKRYGELLHGNPFRERKIVLDQHILDENCISPVTVVAQKDIVGSFLTAVSEISERAKRERGSVLVLIFCHGLPGHLLQLAGPKGPTISITMLQGALKKYVPVCLLTTACYSGGWSISPDINISTMTAADEDSLSTSWPASHGLGHFSGSVFASSIIQSMASTTTELAAQVDTGDVGNDDNRLTSLDQKTAQKLQTKTYNEFCRAVWQFCQGLHRLWSDHDFTFSAQGEEWGLPWNQASSVPLASYSERWARLRTRTYDGPAEAKRNLDPSPQNPEFQASDLGDVQQGSLSIRPVPQEKSIWPPPDADAQISGEELDHPVLGPLLSSLYRRRVEEMVHLWQLTCPGDENKSNWHGLDLFMNRCLQTGQLVYVPTELQRSIMEEEGEEFDPSPYFDYNLADILEYRINMAQLAQHILARLGLPRPGNQSCLAWNEFAWACKLAEDPTRGFSGNVRAVKGKQTRLFRLVPGGLLYTRLGPTPQQGPAFIRFHRYLLAGIVEANLASEEEEKRALDAILDRISEAEAFHEQRARADPHVRRHFAKYLDTFRR